MEKLKFEFKVKASVDGKSNYIAITSIITQDEKIFLQAATLHKEVIATQVYVKIRNTLKRRHQTRTVWIKITDKIMETYFDEGENMIFQEQYLEEVTQEKKYIAENTSNAEDPIVQILEKLVEQNQKKNERKNVKKLAERFVLDKFDGKNVSAYQWTEIFEKECERFDITENEEKIEVFRLFLEKSCLDWYMMIKFTLKSEWTEWKQNFCETYANRGWSSSRYALSFKYQAGSLLEYAIRKEKLLLEVRKTIDQGTLIDIIAAGLPNFITDRINKEKF